MMPALLSIDSPCRTKSMRVDPSSAQASAGPMDSRAVESSPTVITRSRFRLLIASPCAAAWQREIYRRQPRGLSQTKGRFKAVRIPPARWPGRWLRGNSGRADLNAANLLQPFDRVGERLRHIPLRDTEVALGRGVICGRHLG